nr:bifunctional diguanylate cyclase/phosphodiesterase [Massilia niastensis]
MAVPLLLTTVLGVLWWRRAHRRSQLQFQRAEGEASLRRKAQHQIHLLAFRDPTTGISNRHAFERGLGGPLKLAAQRGGSCAVMRIDVVNLGLIETVAGKGLSDELVRVVAERLVGRWEERHVAHFGGGQFAVMLRGDHCDASFDDDLSMLMNLVQRPIDAQELTLTLDCRAGLARCPDHGSEASELLRAAEVACGAARDGHLRTQVYHRGLEPDPRNLTLLGDLRQALLDNTLGYAIQPKLCLSTRRIVGAEMLVRWNHPRYGALSPDMFVPLAEQTGVIGTMTLYLVRHALQHCRQWQELGLDMSLSVNVSVNDLANPELVDALIGDAEALGHMLILEVTETGIMRDADEVLRSIGRLRSIGIRISLDDFGTGHASLTYLQRMAPNELKIDRSFVTNLLHSASDQSIVRTSIQLAHDLGATVTAEGIEDEDTLAWLAAAGCDSAQGFAIARPMPVSEFMSSRLVGRAWNGPAERPLRSAS